MNNLFLVKDPEMLHRYQRSVSEIQNRIDSYIEYLQTNFAVKELPASIIWTSYQIATCQISDIPVPAYTNDFRIVITPEIDAWKEIYLHQLNALDPSNADVRAIRAYYETEINQNHLLQIIGHELAHHSSYFLDDAYESGIWFEEGMVEYISRKYFLTDNEFEREHSINKTLVSLLQKTYGNHSLEAFGSETYGGDYASIFFEYWRSYLAVSDIIAAQNGNIKKVFESYHRWYDCGKPQSLSEWFRIQG